jgi:PAS domain-containing protein
MHPEARADFPQIDLTTLPAGQDRSFADALPLQVWTASADGQLDWVNRRVLDYFGRTFDEMIGAGWQEFSYWLGTRGISFPGWTFTEVRSVSPDGMTFAGSGISPQGLSRGFVVTIPAPGSGVLMLAGIGWVARRRR